MRYFAYIAEQSFKTSPAGERLFYRGGPWSKPYIIPDAETEARLFKKQLWFMRILLGGLIFGQPILFQVIPGKIYDPVTFIIYLAAVLVIFFVSGHFWFRSELSKLKRVEKPVPLKSFYAEMSNKHSLNALVLGFTGSCVFVALGILMFCIGPMFVAGLVVAMFSLCAAAWGYAIYLKLKNR